MNTRLGPRRLPVRRAALLIVALPLAFYAYACSSDSTDTPPEEDDGGGGGSETGVGRDSSVGPGTDSSTGTDSSVKDSSTADATDASDASDAAAPVTCIGNPLTADGGTFDGGVNLDAAVTKQIVTVGAGNFLDGPAWFDANGGFLVYSEFDQTERLWRVNENGTNNVQFRDGGLDNNNAPVGNATRNGLLVTAVNAKSAAGGAKFLLTAPDGGAAGTLGLGASTSTSPNDLVVGPANNIYFTDGQYQQFTAGVSGVYRILGTDGGVQAIQQGFGRANGIALSPDQTKLYVGVGSLNGDPDPKQVLVYGVAATGAVTAPGATFLNAADLVDVPDGMAVDVAGNLWVAEAAAGNVNSGRVEVFSPAKKKLGSIPFTTERPTGVAFGGADSKTLFITTETGVFTYVSRCAGVR